MGLLLFNFAMSGDGCGFDFDEVFLLRVDLPPELVGLYEVKNSFFRPMDLKVVGKGMGYMRWLFV